MKGQLSKAAAAMRGRLEGGDGEFAGVSTDTRSVTEGQLFVALRGPNFDGAEFLDVARERGAAGAVVERSTGIGIPQIVVDDTRLALGRLAAAWRAEQPATVVGITGSNGKTTLKELVAACLARVGPTLATRGNFNNDIGLPLMLLELAPEHRFAVIEMGANHTGEIAYLAGLAEPAVVAITNAGTAHLEGFGSVEAIARGKGEIIEGRRRPDVAVLNADDDYYAYWRTLAADTRVLSFGLSERADVWGDKIAAAKGGTRFRLHLPVETVRVMLPLVGRHNVRNACAAAAIAHALGVPAADIVAGLECAAPVAGRLQPRAGRKGAALYDDSYNANPGSVLAAGEFLATLDGRRWLVLGDMFELGADAAALHADTGRGLRATGIDRLLTLGELAAHAAEAFGTGGEAFGTVDALIDAVGRDLAPDVRVLVKGSRGMRMERVVEALAAPAANRCAEG